MRKLVFLILMLITATLLSAGCTGKIPQRNFTTRDLLIDLSVFPDGWQVSVPPSSPTERLVQIGSSQIEFQASADPLIGAIHSVFRFNGERAADARFDRMLPSWFNSSSVFSITPWQTPAQLPYHSPTSDKSRFACHDTSAGGRATICQFMAQYDEYIIVFHTVMTPEDMQPRSYMTFADLERILKAIDELMLLYLGQVEE